MKRTSPDMRHPETTPTHVQWDDCQPPETRWSRDLLYPERARRPLLFRRQNTPCEVVGPGTSSTAFTRRAASGSLLGGRWRAHHLAQLLDEQLPPVELQQREGRAEAEGQPQRAWQVPYTCGVHAVHTTSCAVCMRCTRGVCAYGGRASQRRARGKRGSSSTPSVSWLRCASGSCSRACMSGA